MEENTLPLSLEEEIKEDRRWKDFSCSCISRIDTVIMYILPKELYSSTANAIKIPMTFITN
jgi:hypothetical protein